MDSNYVFANFENIKNDSLTKKCILRHDIDVDLNAAFEMAQIEAELNIKSTYFLMLRSPAYNLLTRSNHRYVNQIIDLGHEIGLHYDEGFYAKDKPLNDLVEEEGAVIETMFQTQIRTVSFHQPSQNVIENKVKLNKYINTYDKDDMGNSTYISDSNKVWKRETAWDIFERSIYNNVHLLIHPFWWMTETDETPENLWSRSIINNFKREEKQLLNTERAYGKPRNLYIE